ncbi:MAG: hypothetical protein ABIY55_29865 [Kofleriaceae bacterium]
MTTRSPRASTKGDGRRARVRGATHGDKDRQSKRAIQLPGTDPFERILDDEIVESTDVPSVPQLRLLVLETATHLASAQGAIAAAGHVVVIGASGRDAISKLRESLGEVDALLVGLPGSEPLIEMALGHAHRPIVIAASTCGASEAVRRAVVVGADLATARPHDVDRLAPTLLAAARLMELRRQRANAAADAAVSDMIDGLIDPANTTPMAHFREVEEVSEVSEVSEIHEIDHSGLVSYAQFADAAVRELARAKRNGYPLTLAMFSVEIEPPAPPDVLRGIVRARCGNALVNALRDIDLATAVEPERFLVLMPLTERQSGAEVARRIIGAVASGDPVVAGGRTFPPKVIGGVVAAAGGAPGFDALVADVTQLLEQAQVTGASLAVET